MNELDKSLVEAYNRGHWNARHYKPEQKLDPRMDDLKAALYKTIMEIIGDDAITEHDGGPVTLTEEGFFRNKIRNELKAELRQQLKERFGEAKP